jgi:predicted kinase
MQIKMKILYIIRGASGTGKSTLAKALCPKGNIFEIDDFFTKEGEYIYVADGIKSAIADFNTRFEEALKAGKTPISVSNTSVKIWMVEEIVSVAVSYGYHVQIMYCEGVINPDGSNSSNIHNVPESVIGNHLVTYEPYRPKWAYSAIAEYQKWLESQSEIKL